MYIKNATREVDSKEYWLIAIDKIAAEIVKYLLILLQTGFSILS